MTDNKEEKSSCAMKTSCDTGAGQSSAKSCASKGSCCPMMGMGVGGLVIFLWFTASWTIFPWNMNALHSFKDEKAVAQMMIDNAPESGVYVLPYVKDPSQPRAVEKPFAFVSIKTQGVDVIKDMPKQMGLQLAVSLALGAILTCLLKKLSTGCPVAFSMKMGLFAALAHHAPNLIWWHYPLPFSLIGMADDFIAITLAGLVVSKFVLKIPLGGHCSSKGKCGGCGCIAGECKCGGKTASCG